MEVGVWLVAQMKNVDNNAYQGHHQDCWSRIAGKTGSNEGRKAGGRNNEHWVKYSAGITYRRLISEERNVERVYNDDGDEQQQRQKGWWERNNV